MFAGDWADAPPASVRFSSVWLRSKQVNVTVGLGSTLFSVAWRWDCRWLKGPTMEPSIVSTWLLTWFIRFGRKGGEPWLVFLEAWFRSGLLPFLQAYWPRKAFSI